MSRYQHLEDRIRRLERKVGGEYQESIRVPEYSNDGMYIGSSGHSLYDAVGALVRFTEMARYKGTPATYENVKKKPKKPVQGSRRNK